MKKEKELIISKDFDPKMIVGTWESSQYENYKYVFDIKETESFTDNMIVIKAKKTPVIKSKVETESIVYFNMNMRENFLYFNSSAIGNGHFPIIQNYNNLELIRDTVFSKGYDDNTFRIYFHKV
ncbi:hypothetical protein [Flavobacterium sp.]|uniref:hypothetical protein n=1 Tax=Flavobacterium sp. TaxID=239 RepID=UPI0026141679|nr:hypothetical protein [Flavobacterium sp.]MDD2987285.1 hypothetical protein [Flavobacterium sp.]